MTGRDNSRWLMPWAMQASGCFQPWPVRPVRGAGKQSISSKHGRPDKGALEESFVLHELQKNLRVSQEIYYWRTREKEEVDFILVEKDLKSSPESSRLHFSYGGGLLFDYALKEKDRDKQGK